jgi:hypothetical protein
MCDMAQEDGRRKLLDAIYRLSREKEAPPERVEAQPLEPRLARLREWQVKRLAQTYADFLADERYRSACEFFQTDLYGARDFSQRDRDFERLHELLSRILPASMLRLLSDAIFLNRMTADLDRRLLDALGGALDADGEIPAKDYAEAYRRCDNYAERLEQIERLVAITKEIGAGARLPIVGPSLWMLRVPAQRLGWFELYDFLHRGYLSFQPMTDVLPFAQAIEEREKRILERIYAGDSEPFLL